jgi:PAS domain S-box-containing protein
VHLQYTWYTSVLLVSAAVAVAFGIYAWRRRTAPFATPFAVLNASAAVWAVANALEMASVALPSKIFWANIQYLCYGVLPVAWLALILQHTGRGAWLTRRRLALLSVEPAITVVLVWTNQFHGLIRQNVYLDTSGAFSVIGKTPGPWFWVHLAYSYALFAISVYLCIVSLRHAPSLHRRQTMLILIGFFLPLVWNALYNLGISPVPRHDLAPAMLSLSGVIVAWGLFRYSLFEIVPIARDTIVEGMDDGMMVLDVQNRVVDLNPAAEKVLNRPASRAIGRPASSVFKAWPDLIELCQDVSLRHAEVTVTTGNGSRTYDVHVAPLNDGQELPIGQVVIWHDVSERKQAQTQLLQQQKVLAVLEERHRLARELHDDLAQVLGYANVQTQLVRDLLAKGEITTADSCLASLTAAIQDAHTDTREYILGVKEGISPEQGFFVSLEQYLQRFQQAYKLSTELIVPEMLRVKGLEAQVEVQLLRIIQEALTNVRKHACACLVRVVFMVQGDQVQIVVEDNGRGFDPVHLASSKGSTFGLRIMRERAEGAGGTLQVCSAPGLGTRIVVQVPAKNGGRE